MPCGPIVVIHTSVGTIWSPPYEISRSWAWRFEFMYVFSITLTSTKSTKRCEGVGFKSRLVLYVHPSQKHMKQICKLVRNINLIAIMWPIVSHTNTSM
jgi:hypothetical protein